MPWPSINPTTPDGLKNLVVLDMLEKENSSNGDGDGGGGCLGLVTIAAIGSTLLVHFHG